MKKYILLFAASGFFMASCVNNPSGEKAETKESVEVTENTSGDVFQINNTASKLEWWGKKVTASHNGTIDIKSGTVQVEGNQIVGGEFVIDMNSIQNDDQEGEYKEKLVGHLKSDDFFSVENHPEAKFVITAVEATGEAGVVTISGNLTIKDVTNNISFPANVVELNDAKAQIIADFNIAREDWGVTYPGAPDNLISKEINFKVNITAEKA